MRRTQVPERKNDTPSFFYFILVKKSKQKTEFEITNWYTLISQTLKCSIASSTVKTLLSFKLVWTYRCLTPYGTTQNEVTFSSWSYFKFRGRGTVLTKRYRGYRADHTIVDNWCSTVRTRILLDDIEDHAKKQNTKDEINMVRKNLWCHSSSSPPHFPKVKKRRTVAVER